VGALRTADAGRDRDEEDDEREGIAESTSAPEHCVSDEITGQPEQERSAEYSGRRIREASVRETQTGHSWEDDERMCEDLREDETERERVNLRIVPKAASLVAEDERQKPGHRQPEVAVQETHRTEAVHAMLAQPAASDIEAKQPERQREEGEPAQTRPDSWHEGFQAGCPEEKQDGCSEPQTDPAIRSQGPGEFQAFAGDDEDKAGEPPGNEVWNRCTGKQEAAAHKPGQCTGEHHGMMYGSGDHEEVPEGQHEAEKRDQREAAADQRRRARNRRECRDDPGDRRREQKAAAHRDGPLQADQGDEEADDQERAVLHGELRAVRKGDVPTHPSETSEDPERRREGTEGDRSTREPHGDTTSSSLIHRSEPSLCQPTFPIRTRQTCGPRSR